MRENGRTAQGHKTTRHLSEEQFRHFHPKHPQAERTIQDTRSLVRRSLELK